MQIIRLGYLRRYITSQFQLQSSYNEYNFIKKTKRERDNWYICYKLYMF